MKLAANPSEVAPTSGRTAAVAVAKSMATVPESTPPVLPAAPAAPNPSPAKRRPRKAALERKTKLIGVRCTPTEFTALTQAANKVGLTRPSFLLDNSLKTMGEIIQALNYCSETKMEKVLQQLVFRHQSKMDQLMEKFLAFQSTGKKV